METEVKNPTPGSVFHKDENFSCVIRGENFSTPFGSDSNSAKMNLQVTVNCEVENSDTQYQNDFQFHTIQNPANVDQVRKGNKRPFSELFDSSATSESRKKRTCEMAPGYSEAGHNSSNNNNNNESIIDKNSDIDTIRTIDCDKRKNIENNPTDDNISKNSNFSNSSYESERNCDDEANRTEKEQEIKELENDLKSDSCKKTDRTQATKTESERRVYGLRPRGALRRLWIDEAQESSNSSVQNVKPEVTSETDKASVEAKALEPKPSTKPHSSSSKSRSGRSKPLSKYRRITANARERDRMKEINSAFATLRAVLPTFTNCRIASMTKYSTLQLAVSYIKGLSELLNETNEEAVKKENCPTMGVGGGNTPRDVNLSVGISEIKPVPEHDMSDKSADFIMFSNTNNSFSDDQLQGFDDIENLPDMRWALDFILE